MFFEAVFAGGLYRSFRHSSSAFSLANLIWSRWFLWFPVQPKLWERVRTVQAACNWCHRHWSVPHISFSGKVQVFINLFAFIFFFFSFCVPLECQNLQDEMCLLFLFINTCADFLIGIRWNVSITKWQLISFVVQILFFFFLCTKRFVNMVEFISLALFPVDYFSHQVMLSLYSFCASWLFISLCD